MNELLQSFNFTIDKSGVTNAQKYPLLVGQPFLMNLVTTDNEVYTAEVSFNFAINSPLLKIYQGNNCVQGDTVLNSYPTNLIVCDELNDYGLFYNSIDSIFNFYKLASWYNNRNKMDYYEMLESFRKGSL